MSTINEYALTSLSAVREALQLEPEVIKDDDLLTNLVNRISARIENYCRRQFRVRAYTEYHDGDGSAEVFLNQYPIQSVSGLWDDPNRDFETVIDADNFLIYSSEGSLRLCDEESAFNLGRQNIKVTYSGGFITVPEDLEEACIDWVLTLYRRHKDKYHGYMTRSAAGASMMIDLQAIPRDVKSVLDSYKKLLVNSSRH